MDKLGEGFALLVAYLALSPCFGEGFAGFAREEEGRAFVLSPWREKGFLATATQCCVKGGALFALIDERSVEHGVSLFFDVGGAREAEEGIEGFCIDEVSRKIEEKVVEADREGLRALGVVIVEGCERDALQSLAMLDECFVERSCCFIGGHDEDRVAGFGLATDDGETKNRDFVTMETQDAVLRIGSGRDAVPRKRPRVSGRAMRAFCA